jgi:CheY-like chemotaxis protein
VQAKTGPLRGFETVLIVEDDDAVRALARDALRRCGYRVVEASDGEEALRAAAEAADVRLVVTDVVMPRMGGLELARRLTEADPSIRVLFVSGYAEIDGAAVELQAHGAAFLPKPYTIDDLSRAVRKALAR